MKVLTIILGVLLVLGGFACAFTPLATYMSLWVVGGILLMVAGFNLIIDFFALRKSGKSSVWNLLGGILAVLLACFIISHQYRPIAVFFEALLIYVIAIWLIVSGVVQVIGSFKAKSLAGGAGWVWVLIMGILYVAAGIFGLFHPIALGITVGYMIGFLIIMQGVNLIAVGASLGGNKPAGT